MDSPLGLVRMDYSYDLPGLWTIVPHASWRGTYEMASFIAANCTTVLLPSTEAVYQDSTGHMAYPASGPDVSQTRCVEIDFPGKYQGMTRLLRRQTVAGPIAWMGSLMQDAQDASGLMFRRNRYYDPGSGRFTQEDPSGLAGGLNSYGFADGDPVNYSDPYGLAGCDWKNPVLWVYCLKMMIGVGGAIPNQPAPHDAVFDMPSEVEGMESSVTREASVEGTMRDVARNSRPNRMSIPGKVRGAATAGGEIAESQVAGRVANLFTRPGVYMRGAVMIGGAVTSAGAAILTNPTEAAAANLKLRAEPAQGCTGNDKTCSPRQQEQPRYRRGGGE